MMELGSVGRIALIILAVVVVSGIIVYAFRWTILAQVTAFIQRNRTTRQIEEQWSDAHLSLKRPLDFSPFGDALKNFSPQRAAELDSQLSNATIPEIQKMFERGALSAQELTTYYLARLQKYDGTYNTVLELNPDALEIAKQLDAERTAGKTRGPLHGIPVLLKDNIGTGDKMHTTAGAAALKDARSDRDAFIVKRLRDAGAIILGKSNLTEWANFMTSKSINGFTTLGGPTRDAYGKFDVSGSSSGSASAASLHFATVTVGTETTGSLISPASNNGVVAVKPTLGLVSRDRIIPITDQMDSAGPMARNVTDAAILLTALAANDPNESFAQNALTIHDADFTKMLDANALRGKRIGIMQKPDFGGYAKNHVRMKELLEQAGAMVVNLGVDPSGGIVDTQPILAYGFREGVNEYLAATNAPIKSVADLVAFNAADLAARAPYGQDLIESAQNTKMTRDEYHNLAQENRTKTRTFLRKILDDNQLDAVVGMNNNLSLFYAAAGFPAVVAPAGLDESGQPIGLTFVADAQKEGELLGMAYAFEQATHLRQEPMLK